MVSVRDVAKWFLSKESMTHKKLQKLCYYSQAWYCTLFDEGPLFEDEIQAWVHGPVIASLYPLYADYRWSLVPQKDFDSSKLNEKALTVLEAVYNTYGEFSGDQLESLTHSEYPWIKARGNCEPYEICNTAIKCEDMKKYYAQKYAESQND